MTDVYVKLPPVAGTGTVIEVDSGTGLTGGPITTDGTIALSIPVTVAHGGTNSTTALSNGAAMVSVGGKIVESAFVAVSSTTGNTLVTTTTGAFSPPRMTTTQRDAVASPSNGMMIYNTSTDKFNVYQASSWVAIVTL